MSSKSKSPPPDTAGVDIPPSVLAISNLKCPSPPPILNKPGFKSPPPQPLDEAGSPAPGAPSNRERIPAGGAILSKKEKLAQGTTSPASVVEPDTVTENHVKLITTAPTQSELDFVANPPENSNHHKVPSVHAHFYADELTKPLKSRSRSGSSAAASDAGSGSEQFLANNGSVTNFGMAAATANNQTIAGALGEQNGNIDPRLPTDDGKLHVLIGVCGALSVIKVKLIVHKLFEIYTQDKISIQLILTEASENFIPQEILHHLENTKKIRIWRDSDEWTTWKTRSDPVLHIELRRWADVLVVCPLTANTLSKISLGMCDNLLTNVIRAWNTSYPILLAPSMVSYSYNAITTKRQIRLISEEMPWIEILKPVEKVIGSYGDIGMGGMMDWNEIVNRIVMKLGGYPEEEDDDDESKNNNDDAIADDDNDDDDEDDDDDDEDDDDDDEDEDAADEDAADDESNQGVPSISQELDSLKFT
ncbi:phosphopantothenoylcysteine decarboxylase subunit Sis2p [[Candida] railenensis]|uniref:Phosphopantothenoylcysteine decarboxylase subunit Sis2p n=1 Tax=[Candida] railenensis TaxID=45579 RepID=A0A9P0QQD1_9ASCO|nr:phosphopantothenoylcysteine decarboxylase subunit Sis2p [[Candida] railenensis]